MNSIHNNGKDDRSMDEGLDKLGQAYGRLQQEEFLCLHFVNEEESRNKAGYISIFLSYSVFLH